MTVLENPAEVTSSNPKLIGSQISKKITALLSDMKSGSFSQLTDEKNDLQLLLSQKQIITGAESSDDYAAHMEALRSERAELDLSASGSTGLITAPASGYFIRSIDGYENAVAIEDITELTVSDVRALEEGESGSTEDALSLIHI